MNTAERLMYEWKALPWKDIERQVFKLQKRIYQASVRGDVSIVHKLQRLLLRSWAARCLAVRRVTQDNRGKRTPGVDGKTALTDKERMELVQNLNVTVKAQPLRRVWIDKPGTTEKRPLGIPTIADRALQALVKLALEPEWEARFEPNSYGFRPGRGSHDAIEAIFKNIHYMPKYVLDADIAKCFDRINHAALLEKLNTFPLLYRLIKIWLKAGVMDGKELFPTEAGTPQGGVISPLLANIALHGFETAITSAFPSTMRRNGERLTRAQPRVIRYADDFVILHRYLDVIEKAKTLAEAWLQTMGLELKSSKTRLTHTLHPHEGNVGFDFLGFTIRQFSVGKAQQRILCNGQVKLTCKTLIKPSPQAVERHYRQIAEIITTHSSAPQEAVIARLNPIVRGWCGYYRAAVSKTIFRKLDHLVTRKLLWWAKRRHRKQSLKKAVARYWHMERAQRRWIFGTKTGMDLLQHADTPIERHTKVEGTRTPFDGDWAYWAKRMGKHPLLPTRVAKLLKRQHGSCPLCGLYFKDDDVWEVDHILPKQYGGKDVYQNLQLLHGHCHDRKSRQERGIRVKDDTVEEPCEVKVSSTVLKTSSVGDHWA
ncbi:MAG: group II intron reverse transcriptase/maturase [Anaerolineae bacterium]|nr:group II intron reverse transcriptase/maturase [Anaerolineae bacterium]